MTSDGSYGNSPIYVLICVVDSCQDSKMIVKKIVIFRTFIYKDLTKTIIYKIPIISTIKTKNSDDNNSETKSH